MSNLLQLKTRHVVMYCQLSYIPYVFRHFDLLALKILSHACHGKKLKTEKNCFMYCQCHSKSLVMKVN